MAGAAFLFTRDGAARAGGESNTRPLLRSGNNNVKTLNAAVTRAETAGIVSTDGGTIYLAPDAAFMMIGTDEELLDELAPEGGGMTYTRVTSAEDGTKLSLYYRLISVSLIQKDRLYVLAGPKYWTQVGNDLNEVSFSDGAGKSYSLFLGHNARSNKKDKTMIHDLIAR